jgi:hypothetical protein
MADSKTRIIAPDITGMAREPAHASAPKAVSRIITHQSVILRSLIDSENHMNT